jgi:hypothetical protein
MTAFSFPNKNGMSALAFDGCAFGHASESHERLLTGHELGHPQVDCRYLRRSDQTRQKEQKKYLDADDFLIRIRRALNKGASFTLHAHMVNFCSASAAPFGFLFQVIHIQKFRTVWR